MGTVLPAGDSTTDNNDNVTWGGRISDHNYDNNYNNSEGNETSSSLQASC